MKNKLMLDNPKELIEFASLELNISQFAIEKDLYVTRAIQILSEIEDEYFFLVFQGGTCLAKAHHLIHRMSEDCDFRICLKEPASELNKSSLRRALKDFRNKITNEFRNDVFVIDDAEINTRNEGRYVNIQMQYPQIYSPALSMKPFIACEFFVGELRTPQETKMITSMIKQRLKLDIPHPEYNIDCMSIIETASEKWVALTRRIATAQQRDYYYDKNLVRHLYDLYQIQKHSINSEKFSALAKDVISNDGDQLKSHNEDFYKNPLAQIELSMQELKNNPLWRNNWIEFVETMVFDQNTPSYDEVIANLETLTSKVTPALKSDVM